MIARKKVELTQKDVAEMAGIGRDSYSNIETGRKINVDTVLADKIAKVLKGSLEQIFLNAVEYKILK